MRKIPYLKYEGQEPVLMVDGRPFMILGGELHNSSGSDLEYLDSRVWPVLKKLGGNCYLTPVYWECMEPEEGKFDFTLVDGVIAQACRERIRLVFLWFGLWKNGSSSYIPQWMKRDPQYFYIKGQDGRLIESVSPFCEAAVEADRRAYEKLMEHLKETDEESTVIMMQVENEVGVWGNPRDYSEAAEQFFYSAVPEEMLEFVQGERKDIREDESRPTGSELTWEAAFGINACEYFMAWAFAKAVGRIAAAGRAIYPLPTFMNCVPNGMGVSDLAGSCPSGGPVPRVQKIWHKEAPAIDFYGPDIYIPAFKRISAPFAASGAFVLPETGGGKDVVAKALYCAAAYNTICYSPFGIEALMSPIRESDLLAQTNQDAVCWTPRPGEELARTYRLLQLFWKEIRKARRDGRIAAFIREDGFGEEFHLGSFTVTIFYDDTPVLPGLKLHVPKRRDDAPVGGGFILQEDADTFLLCGVSANVMIEPKYAARDQVFILDKREMKLTDGGLKEGRVLNGDERNFLVLGSELTIQRVKYYHRER